MPDPQNALILPAPRQERQAYQTNQVKRVSKADKAGKADKRYDAAKDDGESTPFMSMLNQYSEQTDKQLLGRADRASDAASRNSAEQGGEAEVFLPWRQVRPALLDSISVRDTIVSLTNELAEKGVDLTALSEEIQGILDGLENGASGLDAALDMVSKLRGINAEQGSGALPEQGEPINAAAKTPKPGVSPAAPPSETPVDGEADEDAEKDTELNQGEADRLKNFLQAQVQAPAVPQTPANDGAAETEAENPLAVSKLSAYLKPDVQSGQKIQNETADGVTDVPKTPAAQGEKPAEGKPEKTGTNTNISAASDAGASVSSEAKNDGELSGNLGGRQEEQQPDNRRGAARSVPNRQAQASQANQASQETDTANQDVKTKTNFTENRQTFEQFFDSVTARRDAPAAAPASGLELARGSALSQGEALSEGLNNVVRFVRADGAQRASLIVDPPALGRVSVELTSTSTGFEASIKVTSEQVRQLIQDHLTQLKLALEQQGVQLTHFSVDVQQDNTRGNQQGQANRRRRGAAVTGADEEDAETESEEALFRVDLNQGLLHWVA